MIAEETNVDALFKRLLHDEDLARAIIDRVLERASFGSMDRRS